MKKLIIAAAIVCAAAMSQAASYQWKAGPMTDMDGNALVGDVVMSVYCSDLNGTADVFMNSATVKGGSISAGADTLFENANFTVGTVYKFYLTYADEDGNIFTSKLMGSKAQSNSTPTLGFTMTGGSWQAVPEPTSGLLLLLGVAGLALRRRRA